MKGIALAAALLALTLGACNRTERSDAAITAEVQEDLAEKGVINVTVTTADGVVTLAGIVPDTATKDRAEDVADDVSGVDRVVNNLRPTMAGDAPAPAIPRNE